VVAKDRESRAGLEHRAHQDQRLADARAAIEEIADEDRHPLGMAPGAQALCVAEPAEESGELVGVAVDVADQVVHRGEMLPRAGAPTAPAALRGHRL
jgi:hypothetical protein